MGLRQATSLLLEVGDRQAAEQNKEGKTTKMHQKPTQPMENNKNAATMSKT